MKSVSCSMYILVFLEYSNSIAGLLFTGSSRLRLQLARPRLRARLTCGCDSHDHVYGLVSPAAATRTATAADTRGTTWRDRHPGLYPRRGRPGPAISRAVGGVIRCACAARRRS